MQATITNTEDSPRWRRSIAIGVPTFEAGASLRLTLQSIYGQTCFDAVQEVLVVVDGNRLRGDIAAAVRHPKLRVVEFPTREGQACRINDILRLVQADIVVLTNDDVVLDPKAVERLAACFATKRYGLVAGHARPMAGRGPLRRCLEISYRLSRVTATAWNGGKNYLACNGRLVALSAEFARQLHIPETVRNNDAYMYLAAERQGFCFGVAEAICWYRNPSSLREHCRQSLRFQDSARENQKHLGPEALPHFDPPLRSRLTAILRVGLKYPFTTLGYLGIFLYARMARLLAVPSAEQSGVWETDLTTKKP